MKERKVGVAHMCEVSVYGGGVGWDHHCGNNWKHEKDLVYYHDENKSHRVKLCTTHKKQIESGQVRSFYVSDEEFKRICPDCTRRFGSQTMPFALKAWKPWSYKDYVEDADTDQ